MADFEFGNNPRRNGARPYKGGNRGGRAQNFSNVIGHEGNFQGGNRGGRVQNPSNNISHERNFQGNRGGRAQNFSSHEGNFQGGNGGGRAQNFSSHEENFQGGNRSRRRAEPDHDYDTNGPSPHYYNRSPEDVQFGIHDDKIMRNRSWIYHNKDRVAEPIEFPARTARKPNNSKRDYYYEDTYGQEWDQVQVWGENLAPDLERGPKTVHRKTGCSCNDWQLQMLREDIRRLREDINSYVPLPDKMDTSWDPEPNFSIRLRTIEMAATAVSASRIIQVFYEFLSMCFAEHNRTVRNWNEYAWSSINFHDLELAFYDRWNQEGATVDISDVDQAESIFELCLSELVGRHNNIVAGIGGQQWSLDSLKVMLRQYLVPCRYGKECPLCDVSHRHRPLSF